MSVDS